jgi:hypothetical protein
LVRRSLLVALIGLIRLALLVCALLRLAAAALVMRTRLLAKLILLVVREHAHDLAAQFPRGIAIARTSLGMRLRILIDEGFDVLLLSAGEIESGEFLHPAMLNFSGAGSDRTLRARRRLILLRADAHRQCERHSESAHGQEVYLHGNDLNGSGQIVPEGAIRTEQAV